MSRRADNIIELQKTVAGLRAELTQTQAALSRAIEVQQDVMSRCGKNYEEFVSTHNKSNDERSALGLRIANLEREVATRSNDQRLWLHDIDQHARALAAIIQTIPSMSSYLIRSTELVDEAKEALSKFVNIQTLYHDSDVATHPFSKSWRPFIGTEPDSQAVKEGLSWAHLLIRHTANLEEFAQCGTEAVIFSDPTKWLITTVSNWDSGFVTPVQCMTFLTDHYRSLVKMRSDYAARFIESMPKLMISVMDQT